jgi:lysophospholipase L1-like esterase
VTLFRRTTVRGAVGVVLAAVLSAAGVPVAQAAPAGGVSWLAAGDSYSSGEGIPGSGADGGLNTCARSALAYGPKAADILATQRGWRVSPLAFPACTGATLDEFYHRGAGQHDAQWTQAQSQAPPGGRFDVVSLSFGGNDVGFEPVLKGCFLSWGKSLSWTGMVSRGSSCDVDLAELDHRADELVAGRSTLHPGVPYGVGTANLTLAGFYAHVAATALTSRGTLVVVGYPRLFADTDHWAAWRGDSCQLIDRVDAQLLNEAAAHLDQGIADAVEEANRSLGADRVQYVDRAALFAGHELCSGAVEYLNGITVTERVEHSFHPNATGHQVTAEQVAGVVSESLGAGSPPAPTAVPVAPTSTAASTPAPIGDGTTHFDIGEEFQSPCVVAWPTAPTYTSRSIILTMSCSSAPAQFLFVRVTYPDPDLPITPSTGTVQVHGTITDYGSSPYGYRLLLVDADSITW